MINNNDQVCVELQSLTFQQVEAYDRDVTNGETRLYYENCEVTRPTVFRNKLSGRVGNILKGFDVEITVHGQEFVTSCTCNKTRRTCKHAVALLYSWIYDGQDFLDIGKALKEIENLDKEQLLHIVQNIIRYNPGLIDIFLAKEKPDWDEIDADTLQ
ncbi:MAG TPA: SWIM zinc finger family protein [bacterium]|nr:SWIM zinc finger family protein [bacterium]HPN43037.1 SWIM zinc finger family protein [bacterium]